MTPPYPSHPSGNPVPSVSKSFQLTVRYAEKPHAVSLLGKVPISKREVQESITSFILLDAVVTG